MTRADARSIVVVRRKEVVRRVAHPLGVTTTGDESTDLSCHPTDIYLVSSEYLLLDVSLPSSSVRHASGPTGDEQ